MTDVMGEKMGPVERGRLRSAALRATRLYPGPVGELLARELLSWEDFGYRFGGGALMFRVVDKVMTTPIPEVPVATASRSEAEAASSGSHQPVPGDHDDAAVPVRPGG